MNMELVVKERIEALESIIEHLQENGQRRRRYYQEKCESYRRVLSDLSRKTGQSHGDLSR